jgi:inner membrane protein involved in colicin E2 resistance
MIGSWDRRKRPPVMQRTLADDVKWALLVLAGVILGYLVLAGADTALLLGSLLGLVLVIVVLNVARRLWRD